MGNSGPRFLQKNSKLKAAINITCWVLFYFLFIFIGGLVIKLLEEENDIKLKQEKQKHILTTLKKYNLSTNDSSVMEIVRAVIEANEYGAIRNVNNITEPILTIWSLGASVFFCSTIVTTIGMDPIIYFKDNHNLFLVFFTSKRRYRTCWDRKKTPKLCKKVNLRRTSLLLEHNR